MLISNEYTAKPYFTYPYKLTFILGSRCKDGVVLVADKKITSTNEFDSISFDYKNKLYGILDGVIFGSSGSTDTFELFRDHTIEQVKKNVNEITYDNVIIKLCDIVLDINKKRDFKNQYYFELLVAIRHPDKPSTPTRIMGHGVKRLIDGYDTLGIGGIFAKEFLDQLWYPEITMKEAAALGYFIIKHIEDNKLHSAVGIEKHPPHIWFIPDDEKKDGKKVDYEVRPDITAELFEEVKKNAFTMFRKHQRQTRKLLS
jgi:20S proteasome alpha/beta subunit